MTITTFPRREETAKRTATLAEILHINSRDFGQALAEQPAADPATPSEHLAVRVDRARAKARRWAGIAQTLQGVVRRLLALAERRRVALVEARADAARVRSVAAAASQQARIDALVDAVEAADQRESSLRKQVREIPALQAEIDRLRPLAKPEERRRAKAKAERAKAKAAELAAKWAEALAADEVPADLHRAVARTVGATAAYDWHWASKAGAKPWVEYEPAYYTTPAGSPVYHPNAYGWRTVRHCAVREIHVGRGWLRRQLTRLARLECGLPR